MSKHRHSKRHPLLRIFSLLVMTIVLLAGSYGVRIFSQTKVAVHNEDGIWLYQVMRSF